MHKLLKIEIEIKPIDKLRYKTVGDYFFKKDGTLRFEIADTGDTFHTKMILIHEMIEQALSEKRGIKNEEIDEFDFMYEAEREKGVHPIDSEPGFDPRCPIQKEHTIATSVELMMCAAAGINWNKYSNDINNL